jgi:DNA-directed RNA polymerase subunit M/transcription elongation factor TFIIS
MLKNCPWIISVCAMLFIATATISDAKHQSKAELEAANAEASNKAAQLKCPKCQGAMEVGYALENQGWSYPFTYTSWVAGPIKGSYSTAEAKPMLPIRSFRCTNCGYLEMYAK